VRVVQFVSAIRVVELPVFIFLRSSCSHVNDVGGLRFLRLALNVTQYDGDFLDVILLYRLVTHFLFRTRFSQNRLYGTCYRWRKNVNISCAV
jgi:hypothetical protein